MGSSLLVDPHSSRQDPVIHSFNGNSRKTGPFNCLLDSNRIFYRSCMSSHKYIFPFDKSLEELIFFQKVTKKGRSSG